MPIDVARYRAAITPQHILELLDRSTLQHLLNGFAYKLGAGVSVLWRASSQEGVASWSAMNLMDDPALAARVAHPFCALYRSTNDEENRCRRFDEEQAARYYAEETVNPRLYRCHAGLCDMTYPLRLDGQLLGILFGGQMVVDGTVEQIGRARPEVAAYLDLDLDLDGTSAHDQIDDVRRRLSAVASPGHVDALKALLASSRMAITTAEGAATRFADFRDFGVTLEDLARNLHRVRAEAARQKLLREFDEHLAPPLRSRSEWWTRVAGAAVLLRDAADVALVRIYERRGSRFIERVRDDVYQNEETSHRIPAAICYRVLFGEPTPLTQLQNLAETLGLPGRYWVLRTTAEAENGHGFSILFVFDGQPDELAQGFAKAVALRGHISSLLFHIADDQDALEKRTRHVSHAAKTPLMAAMSLVRQVRRAREPDTAAARLDAIEDALMDARAEIGVLYERAPVSRERVDLRELLDVLVEKMRPLADAKRCPILPRLGDVPALVFVAVAEIMVAFRNLLDNAIKYSFKDKNIYIAVQSIGGERIEIIFRNTGVGIPPDKLDEIQEEGVRANVYDPFRRRRGTGMGVPIARDVLLRHDGTLEFESRELSDSPAGTWLRSSTVATVTLPRRAE